MVGFFISNIKPVSYVTELLLKEFVYIINTVRNIQ